MAVLTGDGLAAFAVSKLGTPYVFGAKGARGVFTKEYYTWLAAHYPSVFTPLYKWKITHKELVGKVCTDCSGLISWYTGKEIGTAQMYSQAYARLPMSQYKNFAVGTVLYKNGHVGVYVGKDSQGRYCVVEARGIDYGTIGHEMNPARWTCGLTFKELTYTIPKAVPVTYKKANPYAEPTIVLRKGQNSGSNANRWLQYELIEAGYGKTFKYAGFTYGPVTIDGDFGAITRAAVKAFQSSCKIDADGEVGPITRKYLIADK
jgi:hypothetical protein